MVKNISPLLMLFLVCYSCNLLLALAASSSANGFRINLSRANFNQNLTKLQLLQSAAQRSKDRVAALAAKTATTGVETPIHWGGFEYVMELSIGTPEMPFSAIVDTGGDLIWTQCQPCLQCFNQTDPIYNPMGSTTFSSLPCNSSLCHALDYFRCIPDCEYFYFYSNGASTRGVMGTETFAFGSNTERVSIPDIVFGCGNLNQAGMHFPQPFGHVGLGRGPLSLTSQLGFGKFSFCFPDWDESVISPLLLGSLVDASFNDTALLQSTPLVFNSFHPTYYFLHLEGITVGESRFSIPKEITQINKDMSGGFIIDSTTTFTALERSVFRVVKEKFQSQVKLEIAHLQDTFFDLCFRSPNNTTPEFPKLIFHFEGADWESQNNIVYWGTTEFPCLAIIESPGVSLFGSFHQSNMHVIYNLVEEKLSFAPAQCGRL